MLGVALTAQRAGWAGGDPQLTIRVASSVSGSMSYPGAVSISSNNNWPFPLSGTPPGPAFDDSGVVSGNRVTTAKTFRIGAESSYIWNVNEVAQDWEILAPNGVGNQTSYSPIFFYLSQVGQEFVPTGNPKIIRRVSDGNIGFLCEWGNYDSIPVTNLQWSEFEDVWVTVIYSASDDEADFANWNSENGNFGNIYQRIVMMDTRTGVLLGKTDWRGNQFQAPATDWADQTIIYDNNQSGGADTWLFCQVRDVPNGDTVEFASGWLALGEVIDPLAQTDGVANYQYFCGQYLAETIAGVRAWINISSPTGATVVGSNVELATMSPGRASTSGLIAQRPSGQVSAPYTSANIP